MRKKLSAWLLTMCLFFVPAVAYADDNPINFMEKNLKPNWKVLEGLDFLFSPLNIVLTLMLVATLVFCIIKIFKKLFKSSAAKESIKDKAFWIEIGGVILILFLFFSGIFWKFLGGLYDWTNNQDVTGVATTSAIVRDVGTFL